MFFFIGTRKPDFSNIRNIDYNEYWKTRGFQVNKKLKEREEIMLGLIPSGSRVADFGCGNSLLPVKLKEKKCEVTVGDISDVVLEGYQKHGIKGKHLNLEEVETLRFDGVFDCIVLSEVLEHTKNPENIVQALKKYTRSFLITIPNSAFYPYRFHLFFGGRFFTQWVHHPSEHIRFWSHIDFLDWLSAMGLEIVETRASNGFSFFGLLPGLKNFWTNMFGYQIVYHCKVPAK